jgi:phosphate:Na+ symporter
MTVMTKGPRALAGSSLRTVLSKAAAAPLSGALGAFMTLLVQSSSATTMTTIGPVSAGLLTFPQGLGLVFGTNVGTRERAGSWRSLGFASRSSYALPMIFVGALIKLLGNGRIAARGSRARRLSACALRTDDSATVHGRARRELASLGPTGRPWWARSRLGIRRAFGLRTLVVFGLVMTPVMQSSTASIAVTLSAYHAGAIGVDRDCAPIIGQNIVTATSSAMAAQQNGKERSWQA